MFHFNNNRSRKIIIGVLVGLLVLCMVLPLLAYIL